MLQKALKKTFVPAETKDEIWRKIHSLKQNGSVADYNAAFRHLYIQIRMDFAEAKYAYLQGLMPRIDDKALPAYP